MSLFDINAPTVLGLLPALRAAAVTWESLNAPAPSEEQRARTRALVQLDDLNRSQASEVYKMIVHWSESAQMEAARLERKAEMERVSAERRAKKVAMTSEMRSIRESLGLSQSELSVRFNLKPNVINNAEAPDGSYANDRVAALLNRYRVEQKLAGGAQQRSEVE